MKLPSAVHMKIKSHRSKKGKQLFLLLCLIAMAGTMCAGEVKSVIITTTQLDINVPDNHLLHIKTFTQQGGVERGVVMVTINGQSASVLSAVIIDNTAAPEIINQVTIAGPATVTVPAIAGATLLITYRKESQPDSPGSSAATPTPTP